MNTKSLVLQHEFYFLHNVGEFEWSHTSTEGPGTDKSDQQHETSVDVEIFRVLGCGSTCL